MMKNQLSKEKAPEHVCAQSMSRRGFFNLFIGALGMSAVATPTRPTRFIHGYEAVGLTYRSNAICYDTKFSHQFLNSFFFNKEP